MQKSVEREKYSDLDARLDIAYAALHSIGPLGNNKGNTTTLKIAIPQHINELNDVHSMIYVSNLLNAILIEAMAMKVDKADITCFKPVVDEMLEALSQKNKYFPVLLASHFSDVYVLISGYTTLNLRDKRFVKYPNDYASHLFD